MHQTQLPASLDPLQFVYRPNPSTDGGVGTTIHLALTIFKRGTYVRLLFIDFSSAFNTTIPQQLMGKLSQLSLNTTLCNWMLDFLTRRPKAVWIGNKSSNTTVLNAGALQGCMLNPLLFMAVLQRTAQTPSSSLLMIKPWWI